MVRVEPETLKEAEPAVTDGLEGMAHAEPTPPRQEIPAITRIHQKGPGFRELA
ncbi:hypothetical protein [Candidatus Methylacidithermus pantelleriae]|uniref:hypothetical protein n=1 Tax=Candidatus Methylacidithermus pantelleriae TaxID=2744239 RepID=UPI001BD451E4|nr:hypothetical protein [Candidatus Methylacidithermus pantelleriae]